MKLSINFGYSIYLYRQIFATFASSLLAVSSGLASGQTAGLLPQLQNDKEYPYDESYDSWIASTTPLAMVAGCLSAGAMCDGLGRKTTHLLITFPFTIGWLIMAFATNNSVMLFGRVIVGACIGAVRAAGSVYIGEITEPKYRSITLFCPTLGIQLGILICHVAGNYLYWRTSCLVFGLPNVICFFILLSLKESPLWLISKGRTEAGIKAFKMFRGEGEAADNELASILERRKEKPEKVTLNDFLKIIFSKPFMKALMIAFFLFTATQMGGVNILPFYSQDLFMSAFAGADPFVIMISIDAIRTAASIAVCLFPKRWSRKMTYLVSGFGTTIPLVALSVYVYLNFSGLVWLSMSLLTAYVTLGSTVTSLAWMFTTEIFPSEVRGFGSGVSLAIAFFLLFIGVRTTPDIRNTYGETVLYASYAVFTLVPTIFLCFMLPETGGRTLQDIEDSMYNKNVGGKRVSVSPK